MRASTKDAEKATNLTSEEDKRLSTEIVETNRCPK